MAAEQADEQKKRKGTGCGTAFLLVLILVLLAIGAIFGLRAFAPDLGVTQQTYQWQESILDLFHKSEAPTQPQPQADLAANTEQTQQGSMDPAPEQPEQTEPVIVHEPAADGDALIEAQLPANDNIKLVQFNPNLAFNPSGNYSKEILDSKGDWDNYWYSKEDGTPVYYDQSAVATVIAFDSAWNDYVNGVDQDVLDLVKADSPAGQYVRNFSKVGKVHQDFELLQIGEIRRSGDDFFLWTYEEISETSNGTTSQKQYHWVYQLEAADKAMQIVNYTRY